MHTEPMSELEGNFDQEKLIDYPCNKCKNPKVIENKWDSSCGGYEDYKYTCPKCNYIWWVDGIDS